MPEAVDAMDEINEFRANNNLPPFERDDCLVEAAKACALVRAEHHQAGHTKNDFAYLPSGCNADAAGCAAWPPEDGWGSCCCKEPWKYGGAAFVLGSDGQRYMQLFVKEHSGRRPRPRMQTPVIPKEDHHPGSECL